MGRRLADHSERPLRERERERERKVETARRRQKDGPKRTKDKENDWT